MPLLNASLFGLCSVLDEAGSGSYFLQYLPRCHQLTALEIQADQTLFSGIPFTVHLQQLGCLQKLEMGQLHRPAYKLPDTLDELVGGWDRI